MKKQNNNQFLVTTEQSELLEKIQEVKKALKKQAATETRANWEQCKKFLELDGWTWESYRATSRRYSELVRKYFADEY